MPPPPYPPRPPPPCRSSLVFSISIALRFITSFVSLILLWMIILCSFSSCDSISVKVRTWLSVHVLFVA